MLGHWKNFEELEENLTIAELQAILDAAREKERREQVFLAALQGVDLEKNGRGEHDDLDPVERAKMKAKARLQGTSEDQIEFGDLGIEVEVI